MHDRMKNVFYYRLAKDYSIPNIFFSEIMNDPFCHLVNVGVMY